jgi:hypothetical protein
MTYPAEQLAEATVRVEQLEADAAADPVMASTDPRFWARADGVGGYVRTAARPFNVSFDAAFDALEARCAVLDLSNQRTEEMSRLFEFEGMTNEQKRANMGAIEVFALDMEGELRAAHARVPEDLRESERLSFLARRARAMVFGR